jgi:hypothetical protein
LKNLFNSLRSAFALRQGRFGFRQVISAAIVFAGLLCVRAASPDTIVQAPVFTDASGALPPSDLNGWFFTAGTAQPFPTEPDPSQTWASLTSITTLNYWLSLVMELGNDPSLLTQLYGLGMIGSPDPATPAVNPVNLVGQVSPVIQVSQAGTQSSSDVPEPVTLELFAGGLCLLWLYGAPISAAIISVWAAMRA